MPHYAKNEVKENFNWLLYCLKIQKFEHSVVSVIGPQERIRFKSFDRVWKVSVHDLRKTSPGFHLAKYQSFNEISIKISWISRILFSLLFSARHFPLIERSFLEHLLHCWSWSVRILNWTCWFSAFCCDFKGVLNRILFWDGPREIKNWVRFTKQKKVASQKLSA